MSADSKPKSNPDCGESKFFPVRFNDGALPTWFRATVVLSMYCFCGAVGTVVYQDFEPNTTVSPRITKFEGPQDASQAQITEAHREAIAWTVAESLGWVQTDPFIQARLAEHAQFLDESEKGDRASLIRRLINLGYHRQDPLVRRRVVERLDAFLASTMPPIPDHEVVSYARARGELRERAERRRFETLFQAIPRGHANATSVLDPAPPLIRFGTQAELSRVWGDRFARAVFECALGPFCGPIVSAYGIHWVRIVEVAEPSPVDVEAQRSRWVEMIRADRRHRWVNARLRQLAAVFGSDRVAANTSFADQQRVESNWQ